MPVPTSSSLYPLVREQYAGLGVNTDAAIERLSNVAISVHCWQGDDVGGFESSGSELGGGLAVTGNYPGKARTPGELRGDLERAFSLIPGKHRLNLHACYVEADGAKIERTELQTEHFSGWIDWAKQLGVGLDFNPTYFAHPLAASGFTLSHRDEGVRRYWIEHGIACRRIAAEMGRALGTPTVNNVWIPDGYKDTPVDRKGPRERLTASLDAMFAEEFSPAHMLDAVEGKLFGIGSESYVVGSHEFYLGYAISRRRLLCLDAGHFHPTETIADKISSVFSYLDRILLHVSRGVRWDSDHVVTLTDDLHAIAQELVRGDFLGRTHIGLDFFDASINRIAAWVIGVRAMQQALLAALLEPLDMLKKVEAEGDYTARLALLEEQKAMPFGVVWSQFCEMNNVPAGAAWLHEVRRYERDVLSKRA